jgi:conjugal transfer pilus assembly protein TraB
VLPNRVRGDYRECFVIAAGYGDISSERAYLRTESLSCVRSDGAVLELRIQGSVYGEDGKVGLRGRLVTKQGQMLANALLAGVVSGIGQGVARPLQHQRTAVRPSARSLSAQRCRRPTARAWAAAWAGRWTVWRSYYIKLAENTFPDDRGRCRPRDRRGDHQGRAHRRAPHRHGLAVDAGIPSPSRTASQESFDDGNY